MSVQVNLNMRLKPIILFLVCFALSFTGIAQIQDDFSDGNFSSNPVWAGDDSLFTVNNNMQIQSKGRVGSSNDIYLSTNSIQKSGEWSCWLRFALSPSTQNFCRFYLSSDQQNLKGPLNGYYVQLGGSTGNTDSITLYKQNGLNRIRLIAGRAGTVAKTNNLIQLKVLCDSIGNWQLFSDTSAQNDFVLEGTATDNSVQTCSFAGFWARYTSGNILNYYFDDVYVGKQRSDTIKPELAVFEITHFNKINLSFTEKMDESGLLNLNSFALDQNRYPSQIMMGTNKSSIELLFEDTFVSGSNHILEILGLRDRSYNNMEDTLIHFSYYVPQKNDILISELMPDPDPSQGLPNFEFIELYNNSIFPVSLNGMILKDLLSQVTLPNYTLEPKCFLILCEKANESVFKASGPALGLVVFPSLNNGSDQISLSDSKDEKLVEINYDLSWYQNVSKQNGGWSLEMNNPNKLCTRNLNWQACINSLGGTPGQPNSNWQTSFDTLAPRIQSLHALNANELMLIFDEPVDSALSLNRILVEISPKVDINGIQLFTQPNTEILLFLKDPLQHHSTYQISVINAFDCSANQKAQSISYTFWDSKPPKQNQLLIDEILFSPSTATQMPNAEFIELFNASNFSVNLKNYILSDGYSDAILPDILLNPDSFLIVCGINNSSLFQIFGTTAGLSNFPTLNTSDRLTLYNDSGYILHQISYQDNWIGNTLKKQTGGWTLEMKDPKNPCGTANNWDVSLNSKGGTPGKINSQLQLNRDITKPRLLRVYPTLFSKLQCCFSEAMDSLSAANLEFTFLDQSVHPIYYHYLKGVLNQIEYDFERPFDSTFVHQIEIGSINDCAGNGVQEIQKAKFGWLNKPDSGDLIINEVLFNPYLNGNDFIELYNRSEKYLDLNPLLTGRFNAQNQIEEANPFGTDLWMIAPKEYIVITPELNPLKTFYHVPNPDQVIEAKLPAMNDDAGSIVLLDSSGKIVDQFIYAEQMHYPLLNNTEGVSLERIDPFRYGRDADNWTSSSANVGYATPTYRNSQYSTYNSGGSFSIDPEVFSPDGDGYKDILTFSYALNGNDNVGKIEIFSSSGIRIKLVCSNYFLGSEGKINWNGIGENGQKAQIGIYIANFETFNLKGDIKQFQKTFVLGGK